MIRHCATSMGRSSCARSCPYGLHCATPPAFSRACSATPARMRPRFARCLSSWSTSCFNSTKLPEEIIMSAKTNDLLAEIRARVARRTTETPDRPDEVIPASEQDADDALAAASAHFFGTVEQIIQTRPVQRIPIGHIAPDNRPEMRQARLIPLPEALLANDESLPVYGTMVEELSALGQSLRARQIQPILVYPGTSSIYPA